LIQKFKVKKRYKFEKDRLIEVLVQFTLERTATHDRCSRLLDQILKSQ